MPSKTKIVETPKPIKVIFHLNGKRIEEKTDNILESFRNFKIEPKTLKTTAKFEISYEGGKPFIRVINIPRMRRFVINDLAKQLLAKQFNNALGIK